MKLSGRIGLYVFYRSWRNHDISIISSHTINKIVNKTHAKGFVPLIWLTHDLVDSLQINANKIHVTSQFSLVTFQIGIEYNVVIDFEGHVVQVAAVRTYMVVCVWYDCLLEEYSDTWPSCRKHFVIAGWCLSAHAPCYQYSSIHTFNTTWRKKSCGTHCHLSSQGKRKGPYLR
jgi:hypothetical protein